MVLLERHHERHFKEGLKMNINKAQKAKIVNGMENARKRYQSVRGWYDKTDKDVTVLCDRENKKICMQKDGEDYKGYYPVGHLRELLFRIKGRDNSQYRMDEIEHMLNREAVNVASRALIEEVETEEDVLKVVRELAVQASSGVDEIRKDSYVGVNIDTIDTAFRITGYEEWSVSTYMLIADFYNKARQLQKGHKPIVEDLYCFECLKELKGKGYELVYFDVDKLLSDDNKAIYITRSKSPYTRKSKSYVKHYPLEFGKEDSFVNIESVRGKFELISGHFTRKEMKRLEVGLNRFKKRHSEGGEAVFSVSGIMDEIFRLGKEVYNITSNQITRMAKLDKEMQHWVDTMSIKDKMDIELEKHHLVVWNGSTSKLCGVGKKEDWPWEEAQDTYKEHREILEFIKRDVERMKQEEELEGEENRLAKLFDWWLKDNGYMIIMESKYSVDKYAARLGKEKDIIDITDELRILGYRFNRYKKDYKVVEI